MGLCLFLPRKAQIAAPAPSFVEACLGETNPTPPRAAIESANALLVRMIEANAAFPLNLLGTPSDHPDFLANSEVLPFIYALRGDRDWKHAPGAAGANRVSPLITQVWKLLERRGVVTASEIQEDLGRELTEAAVLRALHELWGSLRVMPLYQGGNQDTLWEPLQARHQKAIISGVGMSQVTALSVLASVYLQSVVAASAEDVEAFLSPLASRSKVREVVRGLTATRQLSLITVETHGQIQSLIYVEGSLPEFPEPEAPSRESGEAAPRPIASRPRPAPGAYRPAAPRQIQASLDRSVAGPQGSSAYTRPAYKRPASAGSPEPGVGAGRPPQRPGKPGFTRPGGPVQRERGSYRPAAGSARPFTPRPSRNGTSPERSEPGSGLRPDGTPKKTRWRDLPGGRPDQKGKPKRFGARPAEGGGETRTPRPASRRDDSGRGSSRPPFERGRPTRGAGSDRAPFPRSGERPAGGSRPPGRPSSRPGAPAPGRYPASRREEGTRAGASSRPAAPSGPRRFAPPRESAEGFSRPRSGARPYASRSERPATPGRPRDPGQPGSRPFGRSASGGRPATPAGRPARPAFKPGGRAPSGPTGRPSRPGFGQGSRPGTGGFGPGAGRPAGSAGRFSPGSGRSGPGASRPRTGSRFPSRGAPSRGATSRGVPSRGASDGASRGAGRPPFKPSSKAPSRPPSRPPFRPKPGGAPAKSKKRPESAE